MRVRLTGTASQAYIGVAPACCVAIVLIVFSPTAAAFEADGCEKQRAHFPEKWADVTQETPLFRCQGHGLVFRILVGNTDSAGRTLMSLAELILGKEEVGVVWRTWLDQEQTQRLK